ncbi:MAG: RNA polymerase sigma factor [Acidobacteria bacterium]|nr:RNA polymerase sigma factor [Acidobacteriota bacterium]
MSKDKGERRVISEILESAVYNPFSEDAESDPNDAQLLERIRRGDRHALEQLIRRHQAWIYNIAVRMVWDPHEAEDVTQEVLVKVITSVAGFSGRSSFRTWLYRIVVNHVLNMRRRRTEPETISFDAFGQSLENIPDADLVAEGFWPAEIPALVQETKIGCMTAMMLCLDRRQRLVFTLGEIFGVTDRLGADLMGVTPDHFRQLLARARRDLYSFMNRKCGLVDERNPCRCARKTRGFIAAGHVDPARLRFVPEHVRRIEQLAASRLAELEDFLERRYAGLFREHPFYSPKDEAESLRKLLADPELHRALGLTDGAGTAS